MKRSLAAALAILSMPTFAQSNVTLYGVVDMFYQYADGANSLSRLQSGGLSGSRFGLRGSEDLGGGLKANFALEGGINVDEGTSGQGGALFGRMAQVGLSGSFGSISLGRQYSALYAATNDHSLFSSSPAGPSTALIGGFGGGYELVRGASAAGLPPQSGATGNGGPVRINNSIKYESPSVYGVKLGALYGAGEVAGGSGENKVMEASARYTGHGFDVIGSYLTDEARGGIGPNATKARIGTLSGSYNFAPFRLVAGYVNFDDKRTADLDGEGAWVGFEYQTGKTTWKAQYVLSSPKDISGADSKALGVGVVYDLSRRTALYSSLTRFRNDPGAGNGGLGRFNGTLPTGLTSAQDNSITELVLGIRHSF
jgi:predicted porin